METQTLLGSSSESDSDQEPLIVGNFTFADGPNLDIEENSVDEAYRLQRILDGEHEDSMDDTDTNNDIETQDPMPEDDQPTLYQQSAPSTQASNERELDGNEDTAVSTLLALPYIAPTQAPPTPPIAPPPMNRRQILQGPPQVPRRTHPEDAFAVFNSPNPGTTLPIVTAEKAKKRVLEVESSDDGEDDIPISKLASRNTADHNLQQAYDTIESPVFKKKKKKKTQTKNYVGEGGEFTMVGKDKVKIVNIPHTEFRVSANWDPILSERELKDPMYILMKFNKEENLKKNVRIELFYGLINEEVTDRRGDTKLEKHNISEYLHPSMKGAANVIILNWLMKKTYNKRQSTRVAPLAHKIFLFYQLLEASKRIFEDEPIKKWKEPALLTKFRNEYMTPMEERLLHDTLKTGTDGKNGKKAFDYTQPGSSLTHFPICLKVAGMRPTWFLTRIKGASCPKCGHDNMVAVETREQVENKKTMMMQEYCLANSTWVDNGCDPNTKPEKPRNKFPEQHVVCMCPLLAAKIPMTGKGYFICEDFVKAHKFPNWDFKRGRSDCPSCNCSCNCYFALTQWQDVATWVREQTKLKKEEVTKEASERSSRQSVLHKFVASTTSAVDRSGLVSAGQGILRDEELNSNIALRESVQRHTPLPTRFVTMPDGTQTHINALRAPKKRPKNTQRIYNNDLDTSISSSLKTNTNTSRSTDSILGTNIFRPSSRANSLGELTQSSYVGSARSYNEQYKPFRRAISEQLKIRTDLSPTDRSRLNRIYRILCGETENMTDVVRSIADDALTDLVTKWANHDQEEALAHVVKQGIDEMVGMFVSMIGDE